MAVIQTEEIKNGLLGIWKIDEEVEELLPLAHLSSDEFDKWNAFKALQRKKEWLATRALINHLTGQSVRISYHPDGKPYLENFPMNLSISHTKGYAAVLLHNHLNPGIDIELDSRSAEKVASRILTPKELEACTEDGSYSNKKLLIHWCAKEAIFKMMPENNVSYLKEISISLNNQDGESFSFSGTFRPPSQTISINLFCKSVEQLIVVWGWPNLESN